MFSYSFNYSIQYHCYWHEKRNTTDINSEKIWLTVPIEISRSRAGSSIPHPIHVFTVLKHIFFQIHLKTKEVFFQVGLMKQRGKYDRWKQSFQKRVFLL